MHLITNLLESATVASSLIARRGARWSAILLTAWMSGAMARAEELPRPEPHNDSTISLAASGAKMSEPLVVLSVGGVEAVVGVRDPDDRVTWNISDAHAGNYEVLVTYACASDAAGGEFAVEVAGKAIAAHTRSTGDWSHFTSDAIGEAKVNDDGALSVMLRPVHRVGHALMNLRGITLKRATSEQVAQRLVHPATTRPATGPVTDSASVICAIDIFETPELEDWALAARRYAMECYPVISGKLHTDGFTPPHHFALRFLKDMKGVAATTGAKISIAAAWVTSHPDDIGMVAHELTHVIQHYPSGNAGWLVEGIADYERYYVIEPGTPQGNFDAQNANYKQGYQPAAGFVDWLERTHGPGVVSQLNSALRAGKYSDDLIKQIGGKGIDPLWDEFRASRLKPQ